VSNLQKFLAIGLAIVGLGLMLWAGSLGSCVIAGKPPGMVISREAWIARCLKV
jgi:hypothetical protein